MTRDATFLFALVSLAAAALAVGVSGWVLFSRDHRMATLTHDAAVAHPEVPEGS